MYEKNIDDKIVESVLNINFSKFGHLSYKAMKKIIPELEKGQTYDKACMNVGYEFRGIKNELKYKLPPISQLDEHILNPVVLRAVSQTRKVINAIIDKYGSPIAIHIETARDLLKSFEERKRINKIQKENEYNNFEIKKYIKQKFNFEPTSLDILKMKLWREQCGKCVYSFQIIEEEKVFDENYAQINYIIPFSVSFDDSYNNKVLALSVENQNKCEKIPYEYIIEKSEEKWYSFEEFVKFTYKNNQIKKDNLLIKNLNEVKSNKWIERNINDTRYISKFMINYISNNLKFAESNKKKKVYAINGKTTAVLRYYWGLEKDRNESDKHHAQDAVVIACATDENIRRVAEYSKYKNLYNKEDKYNKNIILKDPWLQFREEVKSRMENSIFVSRMPERKITGCAHKETLRSMKYLEKGLNFTVVKRALKSISKLEIENLINNSECRELYLSDKKLYDDIYKRLKEANFKAEEAFKNEYRKYSKKGNSPIVRSIKLPSIGSSGVKINKNKAIAENANMVRVDVFEKDNKYYLVPLYVADFKKKLLPNKAIISNKLEENWEEMNEKYNFLFSLYLNDLVKIKKKNEKEFFGYYISTHRRTGAINLLSVNGDGKFNGIGVRNLEKFEKYQVDILGNINKVKKEKREGIK